ncbi:CLUMA_CG002040, isoform A [Clunio marinus]|uniref:CLUMA_CG002040, isoform A n=1 Tax=Clunio marinus TaxID=568069 RepID=A0A1J1HLH2_9DIPT|nr:CLUMA_CG002040, isoform A [Clunio marinus]
MLFIRFCHDIRAEKNEILNNKLFQVFEALTVDNPMKGHETPVYVYVTFLVVSASIQYKRKRIRSERDIEGFED